VSRVQDRHLARRSLAYTIDATLTCVLLMMPCVAIVLGMIVSPEPDRLSGPAAILIACSFLVALPLGFGYFLVRDGLRAGSLGKRICGLRVVDARTGEPCRFGQSVVRNLLLIAIGAVDLVVPFFRPDGRRIGDTVAGTVVVGRS
jgi:uncharacterized RDD family membrane protein YckC